MKRERLGSRLGFILLSAGCAIGIGNVWKFPYITGQYGGGAFVLLYLFFLICFGVPVMAMEFALGRASRKSPVKLYDSLEPKGSFWHIHGYFAFAGNVILMMFYTTVAGWMLKYFVDMGRGVFVGADTEGVAQIFTQMLADPVSMVFYMGVVVLIGFGVCAIGLQKGLEKITKVMMMALFAIMVVLAVNSVFLKGAAEGIRFYLVPDIGEIQRVGILKVMVAAMNQAFFTLSLGIGAMAIFGSYIGNERSLLGEAVNIAFLDTFVAVVAGLIIFPACFAYGVEAGSGPSLVFITLPNIFNHMPLGRLWGSLFFLFMSFAALSTVFAVFENIIACLMDLFGINRRQACIVGVIGIFILSLPCALGFNVLSFIQPLGEGSGILDLEDFLVSNILLPLGSLIYLLFCVSRHGWGWDAYITEVNKGTGLKVQNFMRPYMTFVVPVLILVIFIMGLIK